ncbi:MAG: hypothetical protein C5S48_04735 [Candidatus Methanogaster sp.]|nr:MAG: hypothetical protein C5S48_04735 [ANME-2 cluster archaeon]
MKKKRLETGEASKLIVLGFLLTIGLLATYYFQLGNHSGMLIGRPIMILYFLARKITAEDAEER